MAMEHDFNGTYNAVSPNPVANAAFMKTLAKTYKKPFFMPPVPSVILKLLLGEMSQLILNGQKISADKMLKAGYVFSYPTLEKAIKNIKENSKKI